MGGLPNESISVLQEGTLIPLSLVLMIIGLATWLSSLANRTNRNEEELRRIEGDFKDFEERSFELQKMLGDRLSDIDRRLSIIQGSLNKKATHD
ncbi:hypothetical protein E6Q11_02485 [Candidatus Dojkabacteria bacterium]|uniref:Uncharacterized protein n=1 Tax=Candidatus Dojkabacteria bacterium TaxID=2099670 RepID=A0A5C7JAR3_9BACT|nr:MAG: hypothetical protein E6Q11_02485 [Candidatus Dojkabacteria bacterium]